MKIPTIPRTTFDSYHAVEVDDFEMSENDLKRPNSQFFTTCNNGSVVSRDLFSAHNVQMKACQLYREASFLYLENSRN